ncbi:extracellular solute-binding protein [Fimbriimonas ginsengisoli]|uniref:extracellular solute-binding protein n=1 Tax=Fimbriimonas ginsengisoli TaxID=1005039 RepID=UPI001184BC8F|nr:extracellular solute-binding protein [Fimbriimonas ginsengisoli]
MKVVLGGALALAMLIVLAPAPPPLVHDRKREPVYFWHMWSGEWLPVVENICKRFNASQSRYEVIPLQIPAEGSETKFLLSAAGGTSPDLVSQWNPILGMWSERGLIQPIDALMTPEERARFKQEAYPVIQKHATYQGHIMALIAGVDVYACYYRLDHLKEIGRDENHLPQTMEELADVAKQLDRHDEQGRLRRVGFLPRYFEQLTPTFGGSFNGPDGPVVATKEQRRALGFIVDSFKRLGFDRVTRFNSTLAADAGVNAPLIAGNYSVMLDGQWRVKQTAQFAPDLRYCVAPLPPPKGGRPLASFTNANYMVIPRASHNPQGALAFVKFWTGMDDPETGAKNVVDMGWLPYCDRVAKSSAYQAYLRKFPTFAPFVQLIRSPNLEIPPSGPLQSFITNEIQKANDVATRGSQTADQALDTLATHLQDEIARQRRLGRGK